MMLTQEQRRRVISALNETHRLLTKELSYQPHLRHPEAIAFLEKHMSKLIDMLASKDVPLWTRDYGV